jgi:hypothetical protein
MKSYWLTPLTLSALLVSLLMHVFLVFSGTALSLIVGLGSKDPQLLGQLQAPTHQLRSQTASPEVSAKHKLSGIKPIDILQISFASPGTESVPQMKTPNEVAPLSPPPLIRRSSRPKSKIKTAIAASELPTPPAQEHLPESTVSKGEIAAAPAAPAEHAPTDSPAPTEANTPQTEPVQVQVNASAIASTSTQADASTDNTFPNSVDIDYAFKSIITAKHTWRVKDAHYDIDTKASVFGLGIEMHSEGDVDARGLRPTRYREFRNNQPTPYSTVDFDWNANAAHFGEHAFKKDVGLSPGAEDVFSAAYQFALQGDKLPNFNLQVFTGRKDYQIPFVLRGETKLRLDGEKVAVLVLAGTREQQSYEFYLAPQWHNLPVRIRMIDKEKGDDYDLVATRVTIDGKTVLQPVTPHEVN